MDIQELLGRYLAGEVVSSNEEIELKRRLATDKELRNEARFLLTMRAAAKRSLRQDDWAFSKPEPQRKLYPIFWMAAASIVIAFGCYWWFGKVESVPLANKIGSSQPSQSVTPLPVFEDRDLSKGFAQTSQAADTIQIMITHKAANGISTYAFVNYDTLKLNLDSEVIQPTRLLRISEQNYKLVCESSSYTISLGRDLWQPLIKDQK